jgi:hypothetical protein
MAGIAGIAGISGAAGIAGIASIAGIAAAVDGLLADGMTAERGALVGPFQGATLPTRLPSPIDKAERLADWDVVPRLQVCQLETLSGLQFAIGSNPTSLVLGYVDLNNKVLKARTLIRLSRPTEKIFSEQLNLVANYSELRKDRSSEILSQMVPQTPYWGSVIGLQAHRHKWTLELISLSLSLASHVEMRFKHAFACLRPVELSPQIQPMIPTPGHASWPSGHATEAYMVSSVLQALLPHGGRCKEQLDRQAARIAVNRTVAGLHYPVDSAAGRLLGSGLADFFVARCKGNTKLHSRGFKGPSFESAEGTAIDFDPRVSLTDNKSGYYEYLAPIGSIIASPLLAFMWTKAAREWLPVK